MGDAGTNRQDELSKLVLTKIENLRPKLLDLTRRNPLVSTKLTGISNSYIRIVDELPDVLLFELNQGNAMRLVPLPSLDQDPKDEDTEEFRAATANARLTDAVYLEEIEKANLSGDGDVDVLRKAERALKDRLRVFFALPTRSTHGDVNLIDHAKINGVIPSYELPEPSERHADGRHDDEDIQTLLLPLDLERRLNGMASKCKTWVQETGINVLHAAFGFLEWSDEIDKTKSLAPLVLLQIKIEKKKTQSGAEFWVSKLDDEPETNGVLAEKLRLDYGFDLPAYEGGSVEEYLAKIAALAPKNLRLSTRRQVVFGVFPSARMAMYRDLSTKNTEFQATEILTSMFAGGLSGSDTPFADEYDVDHPDVEKKVPRLVLEADCSQFSTLVDLADGKNLAVEGPPGTGKSQTIVNAIAAALAAGKKVLFVAEKTAALDVVRSRLEAVGLGEFLLPLQAERSHRSVVIGSVRERMEMSPGAPDREFSAKLEEFRNTRDAIAEYISIMSAEFGGTGLTVHGIVGASIATGPSLDGLPSELQLGNFPTIGPLNKRSINALASLGKRIEGLAEEASSAAPYWRGACPKSVDRFEVDEILALTRKSADLVSEFRADFAALFQHGAPSDLSVAIVQKIVDTLCHVDEQVPSDQQKLIAMLAQPSKLGEFEEFLKAHHSWVDRREYLRSRLTLTDHNALENLNSIAVLGNELRLERVALDLAKSDLAQRAKTIQQINESISLMGEFESKVPNSVNWKLADVTAARGIVDKSSEDSLILRHSELSNSAAPKLLRQAIARGKALCERRARLEELFTISSALSHDQLAECLGRLRNSSSFSFLDSKYRSAKKLYRSISRGTSFAPAEASSALEQLVSWKRDEEEFSNSARHKALFGIHFEGLQTDFDAFEIVANFYQNVFEKFVTQDQIGVREFLLNSDVNLLNSIPHTEWTSPKHSLQQAREGIDRYKEVFEHRRKQIAQLELLAPVLTDPTNTRIDEIPVLISQLNRWNDDGNRIEQSPHFSFVSAAINSEGPNTPDKFAPLLSVVKMINGIGSARDWCLALVKQGSVKILIDALQRCLARYANAKEAIQVLPDKSGMIWGPERIDEFSFPLVAELQAASNDREGFAAHSLVSFALKDAEQAGLKDTLARYCEAVGGYQGTSEFLLASAHRHLARKVYELYGSSLSQYSGTHLNDLRLKIASLDKQIIAMSRKQLRATLYDTAKPPRGISSGKRSEWTEMALLQNEASKKTRHISVRELTHRANRALLELKPCWMMSPLAVAQYLSRNAGMFDLCIIDEASQMTPEDAVGALARCKQAMIVGDTNQLPPSNFFQKIVDDGDADEDEQVLEESILEIANATFRPARRLRWHYRSRHSGLIRFSNKMVYDDNLVVFPSAMETTPGMGVSLKVVGGLYKSGTNPEEARAIVEAAIQFMKSDPDRSLGIVTLNKKQQELIREELEYALSLDRKAAQYVDNWTTKNEGLEQFFVKNLENVQGDERDVIFIGTVYGREQEGLRVMQRFGPINGVAGKRRLNVLFSRAKKQIVTFTSMTPADITAEQQSNPGVFMLKRWLEYSATGVLEAGEDQHKEPDSDFEVFVMDQIRAMGCEPVPQVGVKGYSIDIGIKHPAWEYGYIMGVECDGAAYHSSKSARDRDRLRQEVLEGLGWKIHRIWSTDWFNDPRAQAEVLRKEIAERLKALQTTEFSYSNAARERSAEPMTDDVAETEPVDDVVKAQSPDLFSALELNNRPDDVRRVCIGDTVRIRYLNKDRNIVQFTISEKESNVSEGIVHFEKPIAKAVLGAEEGDEVEVLVGSYVRPALIESLTKPR